jgi:hypothetical protein
VGLILVSGIWELTKSDNLSQDRVSTQDPTGVTQGIFGGGDSDSDVKARIDHLSKLRDYYEQSMDENSRAIFRTMIVEETRNVDNSKLPADLQKFIAQMKKEQKEAEQKEKEQREQ